MDKKVGRKLNEKITDNDMLVAIEQYTKNFPNEKINISKLAEFSNINRHYWYNRPGIIDKIKMINDIDYYDYDIKLNGNDESLLKLPSIDTIIDNNYGSKKRLKKILIEYFDVVQEFYDSASEAYHVKKRLALIERKYEKLGKENEKLNNKIKELSLLCKYYENLYYTKAILSDDRQYRKENNIPNKIIEISNKLKDNKRYSTKDEDLLSLLDKF